MRSLLAIGLLAFALAGPAGADDLDFRVAGGVTFGRTAEADEVDPLPFVDVEVQTDLTTFVGGPRMFINAKLGGVPGVTPDLTDGSTVRALDGSLTIRQQVGEWARFAAYAKGGLATALQGEVVTAAEFPAYGSVGLDFRSDDSDHYLQLGVGPDQRLTGKAAFGVQSEGRLRLKRMDKVAAYVTIGFVRVFNYDRINQYGLRLPVVKSWWYVAASVGM